MDEVASRFRGLRPPAQRRSQETLDRIVQATLDLLDGRSFGEITITEICVAADVSPSSFYARFESKERLLSLLHQRHIDHRREQIGEVVDALVAGGPTVEAFLYEAAAIYLAAQSIDQKMVQTLRREQLDDPALANQVRQLDTVFIHRVVDAIVTIGGPMEAEQQRRATFATRMVALSLRESVHSAGPLLEGREPDDPEVARRAIDMWLSYVVPDRLVT